MIFALLEARRNEIRSQGPLFEARSSGCPPRGARTRLPHLCRRRLVHLPVILVPAKSQSILCRKPGTLRERSLRESRISRRNGPLKLQAFFVAEDEVKITS